MSAAHEETAVIEGELLPDVYEPPAPLTLFGTSDPRVALERMGELAAVLVDVVRDRKLSVRISGREHLTAEAWTTLGGMLGVVPIVVWTKPNETNDGYVASVEARTLRRARRRRRRERVLALESAWASARRVRAPGDGPDARDRSRRCARRSARSSYWPATSQPAPRRSPVVEDEPAAPRPTRGQLDEIAALLRSLAEIDPGTDWKARCREIIGMPREQMTAAVAAT